MSPRKSQQQGPGKAGSRRKATASGNRVARPAFLTSGKEGSRLQKFLANAGVDSRRNCEELIRKGRVTVNGDVVTDPAMSIIADQHEVQLDGETLSIPRYRYFLLNKPKGVVCTNRDPSGRPRAVDLVPSEAGKMFTVGRLDENTQGLLLVTNDGALAEHLAHPRYEVIRRYKAQVAGIPEPETLVELRKGMHFSDGFFRFQSIRVAKRRGRSAFLDLELQEGKNREIRRLLARVGHKVINLERVAFGPLRLGRLEPGTCRELRSKELAELYDFIESTPYQRRPRKNVASSAGTPRKRAKKKSRPKAAPSGSRRGAGRMDARPGGGKKKAAKKKSGRSAGRKRK